MDVNYMRLNIHRDNSGERTKNNYVNHKGHETGVIRDQLNWYTEVTLHGDDKRGIK